MASEQDKIDLLTTFRKRDKFSDQAWNDRGLNPSSNELSGILAKHFNSCADILIEAVNGHSSEKQLKKILKTQLSQLNKRDYDTEEREFICDLFHELTQIVNADFTDNLNRWLYGSTINFSIKKQVAFNLEDVLDTIHLTCSNCGTSLDTSITRKEEGIPDFSWNIVQCKKCNDYSLVSFGPNVKEFRYDNYIFIEQLPKDEFTKEQAEIRLAQMRHLRK